MQSFSDGEVFSIEIFLPDCSFSPVNVFESGQCFRWDPFQTGYRGIVGHHVLTVSRQENGLHVSGLPENTDAFNWKSYFALDLDYTDICASLSALDPLLSDAIAQTPGLRILRQDPWEALCSFLISQNNHIPRIKGIIARFCEAFGEPLTDGCFAFPTPQRVAALTPDDLAPLRCGYRAAYLLDAAARVADGRLNLTETAALPLPDARQSLQTVLGVGPKVAECVLLYGMARWDAFPIDVWIRRAMEQYFPGKTPEFFGPYAGIAQQYLFCRIRQDASTAHS